MRPLHASAKWVADTCGAVACRDGKFNVYSAGPIDGPMVVCIHGGGYTGLTWSMVAQQLKTK